MVRDEETFLRVLEEGMVRVGEQVAEAERTGEDVAAVKASLFRIYDELQSFAERKQAEDEIWDAVFRRRDD